MLVDQINTSLERLEIGLSVENAQSLKNDLDGLYSRLKSYEDKISLYMRQTVETEKAIGCFSEEKARLVNTLQRFKRDALDGKRELALQDLENIEKELIAGNKELKQIWSNYRAEKFSARSKLITALLNILDEDSKLEELGTLHIRIKNEIIGNRKTVSDIEKFCELVEDLIESKKLKPEIQNFVKRLALGEEILLYEITDEVYKWIKNNKLDKKISLSINGK